MKQDNIQVHDVQGDSFVTIQSKVDASKLRKLYGMLSNIYRNPIGSIVREYASNAHDANIEAYNFKTLTYDELIKKYKWLTDSNTLSLNMDKVGIAMLKASLVRAGKDEPILTGVMQDENGDYYFYVKDFGIGMSPERMREIYFNYLSSTKEDTDDEIGGFGIGAKSALAYTHTFFIDTVYMNKEYNYIMSFDSTGYPIGRLLASKDTIKDNGTCIRVPIKNNNKSEGIIFIQEINSKLLYLPNVYYERNPFKCYYEGMYSSDINSSIIIKGDKWISSTLTNGLYSTMHICLDKIPYTIDWTELGMSSITLPIALVFETGELRPTPSRESIIYTKDAISLIKFRIKEVQEYFRQKIKEMYEPTEDIDEFMKFWFKKSSRVTLDSGFTFDSEDILPGEKIAGYKPYKYFLDNNIDLSILNTESTFRKKGYILTSNAESGSTTFSSSSSFSTMLSLGKFFVTKKEVLKKKKSAYLLDILHPGLRSKSSVPVYKKSKLKNIHFYKRILDLHKVDKSEWRSMIKAHQHLVSILDTRTLNYDELMDPNWSRLYDVGKTHYKPASIRVADTSEIKFKKLLYHRGGTAKENIIKSFDDFEKTKGLVVYADSDNIFLLSQIRDIFYGRHRNIPREICNNYIHFIVVYKKDIKKINNLNMDTWYKVEKGKVLDINLIKRAVTSTLMKPYIFSFLSFYSDDSFIKNICPEFHTVVRELVSYQQVNEDNLGYNNAIDKMLESMVERGEYDKTIVNLAMEIDAKLKKNSLILHLSDMCNLDTVSVEELYDFAQILIKSRIRVKDIFYNNRTSYLMYHIINDYDADLTTIFDNYRPFESSLWEDYYEHEKQKTNETT